MRDHYDFSKGVRGKYFDKIGEKLCQSSFEGVQCDGHDFHYKGVDWPHFAHIGDELVTWTDGGENVKRTSMESYMNGRCCE